MKKALSLILVFVIVFAFCGCNRNAETETEIEEEIIYESATEDNTENTQNDGSQTTNTQSNKNSSTTQTGNNQSGNKNNNTTSSKNNSTTQTGNNQSSKVSSKDSGTTVKDKTKTKTIKVLAIGNSYSNDATRYIKEIADASDGNTTILAASLYYPGCSIKQHNDNIYQWNFYFDNYGFEGAKERYYGDGVGARYHYFQVGSKHIDIKSLYEAIRYEDWDYITIQQTPDGADNFSTYWTAQSPQLIKLYDYIQAEYQRDDMKGKKCPPILIHQTWSFNSDMCKANRYPNYPVNYKNNTEMFKKIEEAYNLAAKKIKEVKGVDAPIIRAGEAVQIAQDKYGYKGHGSKDLWENTVYADNISHLNIRGSYLAACVWIETIAKLSGVTIDTSTTTFVPDAIGIDEEDCKALRYIAREVVHGK